MRRSNKSTKQFVIKSNTPQINKKMSMEKDAYNRSVDPSNYRSDRNVKKFGTLNRDQMDQERNQQPSYYQTGKKTLNFRGTGSQFQDELKRSMDQQRELQNQQFYNSDKGITKGGYNQPAQNSQYGRSSKMMQEQKLRKSNLYDQIISMPKNYHFFSEYDFRTNNIKNN